MLGETAPCFGDKNVRKMRFVTRFGGGRKRLQGSLSRDSTSPVDSFRYNRFQLAGVIPEKVISYIQSQYTVPAFGCFGI